MTPAAIRTEKGEDTRRRILDASSQLFAANGYRGTSMSEIIAASGSTRGGFYFHFPSKADLATAVVMDAEEDFQRQVVAAIGEYTSAADQVVALVNVMADSVGEKPMAGRLGALCDEMRAEPDIDQSKLNPQAGWVALVAGLLSRAQAEGRLDPATDPEQAAVFAVGSFIGLAELGEQEASDIAARMRTLMGFVLSGIGLRTA